MAKLHLLLGLVISLAIVSTSPSLADDLLLQSQKPVRRELTEQLSHLKFYWQDVTGGSNATDLQVVPSPVANATAFSFGAVFVFDDALTAGPEPSSKLVGRGQGFYAVASQGADEEHALVLAMTFAFVEGKYNGSTLSLLGRDTVFSGERELPVVGGTGLFRLARGYALAKNVALDAKAGTAVVEYNVFVIHY